MDLAPGCWLGEWTLEAPLGQGGFGRVYRARRPSDGAVAALKVGREPQDVRPTRLEHPHIVRTLEEHLEHDPPFVVLELVEGGDLRELLARGPLSSARALDVVQQLATALDHAHQQGALHLDVKPENVLVDAARGVCKLADFGGARAERDPSLLAHSLRVTADVRVAGTRDYAAPELREAVARLDRRADVYSLGVLAYELLTGRLPLGLDRPSELAPALPRAVDAVLERALARAPERRTLTAGALARDLARALAAVSPPAAPGQPRSRVAGSRLPLVLALAVAVLVGSAIYQRLRPGSWTASGRGGLVAARVAPLLDALPPGARVLVLPPVDLAERGAGSRARLLESALEDAVARGGRRPAGLPPWEPRDPATFFVRGARQDLARRAGCEAVLEAVLPPDPAADAGAARLFLVDLASWSVVGASAPRGAEGVASELGRRAANHLWLRGELRPVAVVPIVDAQLGVSNRTTAWLDAELTAGLVARSAGKPPVRARAGIVERLRDAGGDVRRALSVGLAVEGTLDSRRGVLAACLRDLESGAVLWSAEVPLALADYDVGRDLDRFTVDARAVHRALGERLDALIVDQVHAETARALEVASARLAAGEVNGAVVLLQALRARGPAYSAQLEPVLLLARAHEARRDVPAALDALEDAMRLAPGDARVRGLYATTCLGQAERLFERGKRPWWSDDDEAPFREARALLRRLDGLELDPAHRAHLERLRGRVEDEL